MKIILPPKELLNEAGVYKITFDTGYFYIGSTNHFRRRFSCFVSTIRHPNSLHNGKTFDCVLNSTEAIFEIVEIVRSIIKLRSVETKIIKKFTNDPLLLNRAKTGFSNKGIRWTEAEREKMSVTSKELYRTGKRIANFHLLRKRIGPTKPVIMYDLIGKEVRRFESILSAARYLGVGDGSISDHIRKIHKKKKNVKGYIFKYA